MKLNQKSQSKVIVAMAGVILLLVALCASFTFAYFTDKETVQNAEKITFDTLTLTVTDADWSKATGETHELTDVVPGCEVKMGGSVKLDDGSASAYLRITFNVEILDSEGETLTAGADTVTAIVNAMGAMLEAQDTSTDTWEQVGDAWINTAETVAGTTIDFTKGTFEIPTSLNNDFQGATLKVGFVAEAIQSAHLEVTGADVAEKAASINTQMNSAITA